MAQLRVMSSGGDRMVVWDPDQVEAAAPEARAAIAEAERIFKEEQARGATAFRVAAGKPAERIDSFDKTAEQTIIIPRIAGG